MAYSNVTPPTLPEYDSVAYPYYVLVYNYENGSEDWYEAHLYYSGTAFTYDGTQVTNAEGVTRTQVYADGSWTGEVTTEEAPELSPGLTGSVYQRIYTNHDILDGEGNVWLAADSVTAVETAWAGLKSWLLGYALGLAGKPLPINAREITGYSYNGTVLPKLPEWDRESYPYAVISRIGLNSSSDEYALRLFRSAYTTSGNSVLYSRFNMTADIGKIYLRCSCPYTDLGDGTFVWGEFFENQIKDGNADGIADVVLVGKPVWCNYDLETNDGTVWLAASEPTPIY